jgi:GNAT superfamily N-acetyltransferase
MNDDFVIERVNEQNFNEFLSLIEKLAEYEKLTPPDEGARARLKEHGLSDSPKYEAFIARTNGNAVAYLIYFFNYSSFLALPTLYIEDIFVLKEQRRQGIGSRVFEFCVSQAREHGCGRIEFCVLTWNEPAISFYEKNNAERLDWYFYRLDSAALEKFKV